MDKIEELEEEIQQLSSELSQLRAERGWRDISTAPRDGAWILLCGGTTTEDDYNRTGVKIDRVVVGKFSGGSFIIDFENYIEADCWDICFWDGNWRTGYVNATHWMPLPILPKLTDSAQSIKEG